jgi:hypothetical protein
MSTALGICGLSKDTFATEEFSIALSAFAFGVRHNESEGDERGNCLHGNPIFLISAT